MNPPSSYLKRCSRRAIWNNGITTRPIRASLKELTSARCSVTFSSTNWITMSNRCSFRNTPKVKCVVSTPLIVSSAQKLERLKLRLGLTTTIVGKNNDESCPPMTRWTPTSVGSTTSDMPMMSFWVSTGLRLRPFKSKANSLNF